MRLLHHERGRKTACVSFWTIGLVVALKGALLTFLRWKGWWPDWEERARQREEEKKVLVAYRQWKRARADGTANPRVTANSKP
jgi:hypothetical protein